ncbi:hypothetical protein ASD07_11025 [Duganella sp. Root336D2]|nr:hypothetical protein ASD07_11025 [Duganella sp. Root336D2]
MNMKTEIAQEISTQMTGILAQLNSSIEFAMENCTDSEFHAFRMGVGRVMGALVLDVLNKVDPSVKTLCRLV